MRKAMFLATCVAFLALGPVRSSRLHATTDCDTVQQDGCTTGTVANCFSCGDAVFACGVFCAGLDNTLGEFDCEDLVDGGTSPNPVECNCALPCPD